MLRSQLVTSRWADRNMYFRHQRFDDDLRYKPEWTNTVLFAGSPVNGQPDIRPYEEKVRSSCPFAWFFE